MSQSLQPPDDRTPCPCGSGQALAVCCGPYLAGGNAATAQALMRSRYTANVLGHDDHLLRTWHPSTRPSGVNSRGGPAWCGLEVRACAGGAAGDASGTVEFVARYLDGGRIGVLHEISRFVCQEGVWYYVDGEIRATAVGTGKTGRNDPCPCGSGRKFKRCCG